jgi:signal transduction histidine kinase
MSEYKESQSKKRRSLGRRLEDWYVREKLEKQYKLVHIGQIITSEMDIDLLFEVIIDQTNQIMDTERSTAFLFDDKRDQLWSFVATGIKRNEIRIPSNYGVVGWVFKHKTPLLINDPYNDTRFYAEVDKKSGFKTKNIICVPLVNRKGQCVGAYQALNKKTDDFDDENLETLISLSYYVTIALENARLYEEQKMLDKAKERIINHLSHEMKTPLAILSGVLNRTSKKLEDAHITGMENSVKMGRRNISRLIRLHEEIDDILSERSVDEKTTATKIIEDAISFIEEAGESHPDHGEIMKLISGCIEKIYSPGEIFYEKIHLNEFLSDICRDGISRGGKRDIEIVTAFGDNAVLYIDRHILEKLCAGLLKNAIENTPDEGRIKINTQLLNDSVIIRFRDYGVGISPENQKMIFGGFFHTQDTLNYSSKEPYAFNAGGSGSDLLRMKVFSERYGFSINVTSSRCKFIPDDADMCQGRISDCVNIKGKEECLVSGGSIFTLTFPSQFVMR